MRLKPAAVTSYASTVEMAASYKAIRANFFKTPPPAPPPAPTPPVFKIKMPAPNPVETVPSLPKQSPGLSKHIVIFQTICMEYGITENGLLNPSRKMEYVNRRWLTMAVCHKFTDGSMPQIGKWLGGMDHSTVLSGLRQVALIVDEMNAVMPPSATVYEWVRVMRGYLEGDLTVNG